MALQQQSVPFTAAAMMEASSAAEARAGEVARQDAIAASIELQRANLYASWAILAQLQGRVGEQG